MRVASTISKHSSKSSLAQVSLVFKYFQTFATVEYIGCPFWVAVRLSDVLEQTFDFVNGSLFLRKRKKSRVSSKIESGEDLISWSSNSLIVI